MGRRGVWVWRLLFLGDMLHVGADLGEEARCDQEQQEEVRCQQGSLGGIGFCG